MEVLINNIPSSCPFDNCSFHHTDLLTPKVFLSFPSGGSDGTSITILGEGFTSIDGSVNVTIGEAACRVTLINDSVIQCEAGNHKAGPHKINVLVPNFGFAQHTEGEISFSYQLSVDSISNDVGGHGGGTILNITGNGFPDVGDIPLSQIQCYRIGGQFNFAIDCKDCLYSAVNCGGIPYNFTNDTKEYANYTTCMTDQYYSLVQVDGQPCLVLSSNLTHISCVSPANPLLVEQSVNVTIEINERQVLLENAFTYENSSTPYLTGFESVVTSVLDDVVLNFYGIFPDVVPEVWLDKAENCSYSQKCEIQNSNSSQFTCTLQGGQLDLGYHIVMVYFPEYGFPVYCNGSIYNCSFSLEDHPIVEIEFSLDFIYPLSGSVLGGTQLSLYGRGFPVNLSEEVAVTVDGRECDISSVSHTSIECITSGLQKNHHVKLVSGEYTYILTYTYM